MQDSPVTLEHLINRQRQDATERALNAVVERSGAHGQMRAGGLPLPQHAPPGENGAPTPLGMGDGFDLVLD